MEQKLLLRVSVKTVNGPNSFIIAGQSEEKGVNDQRV